MNKTEICVKIKKERQRRSLSQKSLAKTAKVAQGSISLMERNPQRASNEIINKVADALEISTLWIFCGWDFPFVPPAFLKSGETKWTKIL